MSVQCIIVNDNSFHWNICRWLPFICHKLNPVFIPQIFCWKFWKFTLKKLIRSRSFKNLGQIPQALLFIHLTKFIRLRKILTNQTVIFCHKQRMELSNFLIKFNKKCFSDQQYFNYKPKLKMKSTFYEYMVDGIIKSGIIDDGGDQCYSQIPFYFHLYFNITVIAMHLYFVKKWNCHMDSKQDQEGTKTQIFKNGLQQNLQSSFLEKIVGFCSLSMLLITFYFKLKAAKGLFIFNPCHIALSIMICLLFCKSTTKMRMLHTYWTGWLFGAYIALLIPHLEGINSSQILLYYIEHLLLTPIGPILLSKRYGFKRPLLSNHFPAFASFLIYQCTVLCILARTFKVNLNFVLCHSHADPWYDLVGYGYYVAAIIHLNMISYLCRWLTYILIEIWKIGDRKKLTTSQICK